MLSPSRQNLFALVLGIFGLSIAAAFIHWLCGLWIRTGGLTLAQTSDPDAECPVGSCGTLIIESIAMYANESLPLKCLSEQRVTSCYDTTSVLFCKLNTPCPKGKPDHLTAGTHAAQLVCSGYCGNIEKNLGLAKMCEATICKLVCLQRTMNLLSKHGNAYIAEICPGLKAAREHLKDFDVVPDVCKGLIKFTEC